MCWCIMHIPRTWNYTPSQLSPYLVALFARTLSEHLSFCSTKCFINSWLKVSARNIYEDTTAAGYVHVSSFSSTMGIASLMAFKHDLPSLNVSKCDDGFDILAWGHDETASSILEREKYRVDVVIGCNSTKWYPRLRVAIKNLQPDKNEVRVVELSI